MKRRRKSKFVRSIGNFGVPRRGDAGPRRKKFWDRPRTEREFMREEDLRSYVEFCVMFVKVSAIERARELFLLPIQNFPLSLFSVHGKPFSLFFFFFNLNAAFKSITTTVCVITMPRYTISMTRKHRKINKKENKERQKGKKRGKSKEKNNRGGKNGWSKISPDPAASRCHVVICQFLSPSRPVLYSLFSFFSFLSLNVPHSSFQSDTPQFSFAPWVAAARFKSGFRGAW